MPALLARQHAAGGGEEEKDEIHPDQADAESYEAPAVRGTSTGPAVEEPGPLPAPAGRSWLTSGGPGRADHRPARGVSPDAPGRGRHRSVGPGGRAVLGHAPSSGGPWALEPASGGPRGGRMGPMPPNVARRGARRPGAERDDAAVPPRRAARGRGRPAGRAPRRGSLTIPVAERCERGHGLTARERAFLERLAFWEDSVARALAGPRVSARLHEASAPWRQGAPV